jgi:hypothetical protein
VSVSGSSITKTVATAAWDAGAVSTRAIASGDGYVEFTVTARPVKWMAGLSNGNSGVTYQDIDFALFANEDGYLYVFEGGTYRASVGPYAASDRLRVSIESGRVRYRRNGALLYESTVSPTYPLLLDTSLMGSNTIASASIMGTLR